jgi:anti-sigma B factor antagonist
MERRVNDGLAQLETEERGDVVVARLTGEVDVSCASHMGDRIASAVPTSARALVVDFSDLEFIDSSGVAMLFMLSRRLGSRRQELHCVAPENSPVARVLQIVEFDRAAAVHSDLDQALAGVGGES